MRVDEFLHPVEETVKEVEVVEPEHVTSLTPSGIECWYSWEPRRHYKLREHITPEDVAFPRLMELGGHAKDERGSFVGDWREVPSVTTVLNVLDKSGALTWWGMKVGVEGFLKLLTDDDGPICTTFDGYHVVECPGGDIALATDDIVALLTKHKLTVNHVKDKASTRGVNVHSAFERWAEDQSYRPVVDTYPETEQGYIRGLISFLDDLGEVEDVESEVMVGSIVHGFAGRYDVRMVLPEPREMVTRIYPKRAPKREIVPAGRWLKDVKTSKNVYPSHAAQLAGYELGSVEDGYGETDYQAVIHLTDDGRYELVRTYATADDFLSILAAYQTMQGAKGWT